MSYKNNVIKIDLRLIHHIYFRNRKQKKQENAIENLNLMKIL